MGLLLLRVVAGGAATIQGAVCLASGGGESGPTTWILGLSALVSGAALIAGLFTPFAGIAAGVVTLVIAVSSISPSATSLLVDRTAAMLVMADAAALALLGPGALSVDAYLFGRREIIIPHGSSSR